MDGRKQALQIILIVFFSMTLLMPLWIPRLVEKIRTIESDLLREPLDQLFLAFFDQERDQYYQGLEDPSQNHLPLLGEMTWQDLGFNMDGSIQSQFQDTLGNGDGLISLDMEQQRFSDWVIYTHPPHSSERPLRLLVMGDSLAGEPSWAFSRALHDDPNYDLDYEYKISSSVINTDFWDWPAVLGENYQDGSLDIILVFLGSNDAQRYFEGSEYFDPFNPVWLSRYKQKLEVLLKVMLEKADRVYWTEIPAMRESDFHAVTRKINTIVHGFVKDIPRVHWLGTEDYLLSDPELYTSSVIIDGKPELIRSVDGVHFRREGADLIVKTTTGSWQQEYFEPTIVWKTQFERILD